MASRRPRRRGHKAPRSSPRPGLSMGSAIAASIATTTPSDMSITEPEAPQRALALEPASSTSRAARPSGRRMTRVLSVLSVGAALAATSAVLVTAAQPSAAGPIEKVTADAWEATGALSDALRHGATRDPARVLAQRAAGAVEDAGRRVEALELPISDTPLRARVLATLRADAAWIDAVGSTLADPRSPRRAGLSSLAKRAATGAVLVAVDVEGAEGTVGGTGRLLSATGDRLQPGPAGGRIE